MSNPLLGGFGQETKLDLLKCCRLMPKIFFNLSMSSQYRTYLFHSLPTEQRRYQMDGGHST